MHSRLSCSLEVSVDTQPTYRCHTACTPLPLCAALLDRKHFYPIDLKVHKREKNLIKDHVNQKEKENVLKHSCSVLYSFQKNGLEGIGIVQ